MITPDDDKMVPMNEEDMMYMDEVKEVITPEEAAHEYNILKKLEQFEERSRKVNEEKAIDELKEEVKSMDTSGKLMVPKNMYTIVELIPMLREVNPETDEFTGEDYCDEVDNRYAAALKRSANNTHPFWLHWSLALNKIWLQRCHASSDDISLMACFVYWWNKDEQLRLRINKPLHNQARKKRLVKDAKGVRKVAVGEVKLKPNSQGYAKILVNYDKLANYYIKYFAMLAKAEDIQEEGEG